MDKNFNTMSFYERFSHYIEIGDKLNLTIISTLEIKTDEETKLKTLVHSKNNNFYDNITIKVIALKPYDSKPFDLGIEGKTEDNYTVKLKLSQCRCIDLII